jgi:ribosomal protein L44E
MSDRIDLTEGEREGECVLRLQCTKCKTSHDEGKGGRLTKPYRFEDDPDTVARCWNCGKKHSEDSLKVLESQAFAEEYNEGKIPKGRVP